MKKPTKLPNIDKIVDEIITDDVKKYLSLIRQSSAIDKQNRYLHWDEFRHRDVVSDEFTHEQWWAGVKNARMQMYRAIPLVSKDQKELQFCQPGCANEGLFWIERHGSGNIKGGDLLFDKNVQKTYLVNSLINEAINSSQLEGASTTRRIAKEMIREERTPNNKSEQMILNNYKAMQFINNDSSDKLTVGMIKRLHKIVTEDTLDNKIESGNFRTDADRIEVVDHTSNTVLHVPPPASELEERMQRLCDFANTKTDKGGFIPPIVKGIILHFMLAYDHPFVDGNGRTARALFYWFVMREDYWILEYISISDVIKKAPAKYKEAFLFTETDDLDLTYFIMHQIDVIIKAIKNFEMYISKKEMQKYEMENLFEGLDKLRSILNKRQEEVLINSLNKPGVEYKIKKHKNIHNITYQTARADLLSMCELFLLEKRTIGREFIFKTPNDIKNRFELLVKKESKLLM